MSDIAIRCPHCNTKYRLSEELVGKKVKCKSCDESFRVEAEGAVTASSSKKKKSRKTELDDWDPGDALDENTLPEQTYTPRRRVKKTGPVEIDPSERKPKREVENISKGLLFGLLGGGAAVMITAIVVAVYFGPGLVGAGSGSDVEAPTNFVRYKEQGTPLTFDYPEGWDVEYSGGSGGKPSVVRIAHDNIKIEARDSVGGNAIGDMFKGGGGKIRDPGEEPRPEDEPVHQLHLLRKEFLMREDPGYEEGAPQVVKTGMGSSRMSEFKRPSGFFGGSVVGYRVTVPPSIRSYTIFCECSESQFPELKSVFVRIIESLQTGAG